MGYRISLKTLSLDVLQEITTTLKFKAELSYLALQHGQIPNTISFFKFDGDDLIVPYHFGRELFGPVKREYPESKVTFKRTSDFRNPDQKAVYDEMIKILKEHYSVNLIVYTAFGKTALGCFAACELPGNKLFLFTSLFLARSWKKAFLKHTTCPEEAIVIVERTKKDKTNVDDLVEVPSILLVSNERVLWIPERIRKQYQLVVVDESHEWCTTENAKAIMALEPERVITLTATSNRSDGLYKMIEFLGGHTILRKSERPFTIYKVETQIKPVYAKGSRSKWWDMIGYLSNNEARNNMIADLIMPEKKVLILTSLQEHVDKISDVLTARGIKHSKFYKDMTSYTDCGVTIATYAKCSTGFDQELACEDFDGKKFDTLILASSLKDHLTLEQSVGRCMRTWAPSVIDLVDSNKIFHNHWLARCRWYRDHAGEIITN